MKGGKHVQAYQYCMVGLLFWGCAVDRCFAVDAYKASVIAATAGVTLDVASSWGKLERQPLYRSSYGRFHSKGAVIRIGMLAGALIAQKIAKKKAPNNKFAHRAFVVVNLFVGGSGTAAAIHNWR